ncbi:ATP-binding protein, partial [Mycobacteroides abscessus subsp. abscessus]
GGRRGVLLAGPPGVGKTAIASVVAAEMVGPFTVVCCDVSAAGALRQVFDECVELGPSLVVIEDVDLIVTRRGRSDYLLSEFLAALDSHADAALLVIATTNDVTTLDVAAVRAARFDSIIEVPYPNSSVAQQIISVLINGVPGGADIDCAAVARALPRETSGADIREIVRRAVLQEEPLSTETLLAQISAGRYKPILPASGGSYI